MKKPSRVDIFKELVKRIDSDWKGCRKGAKTKDIKFIGQLISDLIDTEMERDAYKVRYIFLSQYTGLKAYLDGTIEKAR